MANLIIHEVDADLKARLRDDAARHGRSIDEHVRILLARTLDIQRSAVPPPEPVADAAAGADAVAADTDYPEIEHIELVVDNGPCRERSLREHTRVEYGDIKVRFSLDASTKRFGLFTRYFPCDIADISVRGARLRTTSPLRDGDPITLYFRCRSGEKVSIHARVVRVTMLEGKRFEYGVQFLEVMPQGDLRSLICRKVVDQKFHD